MIQRAREHNQGFLMIEALVYMVGAAAVLATISIAFALLFDATAAVTDRAIFLNSVDTFHEKLQADLREADGFPEEAYGLEAGPQLFLIHKHSGQTVAWNAQKEGGVETFLPGKKTVAKREAILRKGIVKFETIVREGKTVGVAVEAGLAGRAPQGRPYQTSVICFSAFRGPGE